MLSYLILQNIYSNSRRLSKTWGKMILKEGVLRENFYKRKEAFFRVLFLGNRSLIERVFKDS